MTTRRSLFALPALAAASPTGGENWLLVDAAGIQAAKRKASRHEWARRALARVVAEADRAVAAKLEIPDRGGQWPHWYSCKRDGARLRTESPTRHRCPVCGEIYTGDPYDAVVLYGVHSRYSNEIRDCGLAFRLTGKSEYARRAAAILTGYADRYGSYRLHNTRDQEAVGGGKIMAQTLDESVWLIPAAWGYALIRDTLSSAERKHIEQRLFIAAAEVIRQHKMGIHNIQCWKNSAIGLAGYVSGNAELVREAIEDPDRGFLAQIAKGVTEEGLWWEGSVGYHTYTMNAVWPLAEAARLAGRNLYSERLSRMWSAPLLLSLPNGDSPGFNDNAGGNLSRLASGYELAYARWRKPEFGALAAAGSRQDIYALLFGEEELPQVSYIPDRSSLLKDAGFAVLRQGGVAVAVRFGRHGGGHGHPDKLNIVTFGKGVQFGLDPGSINYGVALHQEWYKSTIAHNTVAVDGANQGSRDGKLEQWSEGGGDIILSASADDVYPGVSLRRTLTLKRDGTLRDRFECASEGEHTYDYAFHSPGELRIAADLPPRPEGAGKQNGYQHMKEVAAGVVHGGFSARWANGGATLTLEFKGEPDTEIIRAVGPGRNPADRIPMIVVRRKAARTVFEVTHTIR